VGEWGVFEGYEGVVGASGEACERTEGGECCGRGRRAWFGAR